MKDNLSCDQCGQIYLVESASICFDCQEKNRIKFIDDMACKFVPFEFDKTEDDNDARNEH